MTQPHDYPDHVTAAGHVAPVPRRIRGRIGATTVFDTTRAWYFFEWPPYPQYYVPRADVREDVLVAPGETERTTAGLVQSYGLRVGGVIRSAAARVVVEPSVPELADTVRFTWSALDAWYEEDEEVYVHPRNPFHRVDALRSSRSVRVELDGVVRAETSSPVLVFETGLPTRYYLDPTAVRFEHLVPSGTVTACPYKGTTGGYWSASINGRIYDDIAWSYAFALPAVGAIAGLIAFYNERVDITLDGVELPRPRSPFS